MLTSLKVNGYRKLSEAEFTGFSRVNFFVGSNNVGKTSLLEAIYIWACGFNIAPLLSGVTHRQPDQMSFYRLAEDFLFYAHNRKATPLQMTVEGMANERTTGFSHSISLNEAVLSINGINFGRHNDYVSENDKNSTETKNRWSRGVRSFIGEWKIEGDNNEKVINNIYIPDLSSKPHKQNYNAVFVDILDHRLSVANLQIFSILKRNGLLENLICEMQRVFPEIENIDSLPYPDGSLTPLSVKIKNDGYIPLRFFGDGMQRWFHILGLFVLYSGYIICIDEIDATLHPVAQKILCENIIRYAEKYDVQLFITTHNIEFLDNFLNAFDEQRSVNDGKDEVRIITLKDDTNSGNIKSRTLSGTEALQMRNDFRMELR